MPRPSQDFRARFQCLRKQHTPGVSLEDLHYNARRRLEAQGTEAVSLSTLQKRVAPGAELAATPDLLLTLAAAVDVPPEEFPEYRLAMARRQLDEREVGLDQAIANLDLIETAMQTQRPATERHASAPEATSRRPPRASGRATRSRKAG